MLEISLEKKTVLFVLVITSIILTLINTILLFNQFYLGSTLKGLSWIFYVDGDNNIPTWFSSFALLFCSILLGFIAVLKKKIVNFYSAKWFVLSTIFLLMSIDEVAMIHEKIGDLLDIPELGGWLHYSWIVFGITLIVALGIYYFRFLLSLPRYFRNLILVSAGIFLAGALGVEMINSRIEYTMGAENLTYALMTTLEEFLENIGVEIFAYSLLEYMSKSLELRTIQISNVKKI
ncbi:hypothetical protein GS597_12470 [Synechococcales cyanobacterium C]|uniref:Uncharacterized protein n=1 Tax=Petrachloros mirabilis ULC683 TaxID=2781853 RepID=A0A8K2A049_9CYAN|nr:hypothetical protein [Petrachloros mirabilis]NCJ07306.1 hypothetical protein [Petrachloros mirabilis ULC683]